VDAAWELLPTGHPDIRHIEFHYGRFRAASSGICQEDPNEGFVVFETLNPADDLWVTVKSDASGLVAVTGTLGHYPPTRVCIDKSS
jgi:hypothetical protein